MWVDPAPGPPPRPRRLAGTDRKWALGLLLLAAAYAAGAVGYQPDFVADPLGPRAFPWLLAAILAVTAAALLLRARPRRAPWPDRRSRVRLAAAIAVFLGYAAVLEPLGFVLATTALVGVLGVLFGASPSRAVAAGVGIAAALYAVFVLALGLALPAGPLF